jgi:hypothetical protein
MRMSAANSFPYRHAVTRSKKDDRHYPAVYANHARAVLAAFVETHGGQVDAAALLDAKQSTLSRALKPDNQPSLKILINLARVTGRSLDAILGLDLAPLPSPSDDADR